MRNVVFALLCLFPVFAGCSYGGNERNVAHLSGRNKGYNVILLIVDAMRPDHLGVYGYGKGTTPNIDALAREGVVFENAFSQSALTISGVASIFTSLHPRSHGMCMVYRDAMPTRCRTLAQILQMYGYDTAWFGVLDDPHTGKVPGMLRGFVVKEWYGGTPGDMAVMLDWVKKRPRNRPFFLTVHAYDVHESALYPSAPPNRFYRSLSKKEKELFQGINSGAWEALRARLKEDPASVGDGIDRDWVEENAYYIDRPFSQEALNKLRLLTVSQAQKSAIDSFLDLRIKKALNSLSDSEVDALKTLFDAAVNDFDIRFVKRLVACLKERGIAGRTLIIVTADHGNEFKERDTVGHGRSLYAESVHVPLIFHIPGLGSRRVDGLAAQVDIMPTLLDLLGIVIPEQAQGISLVGQMEGKVGALSNECVLAQSINGTDSIRTREWELMRGKRDDGHPMFRLYDLRRDPGERNDLSEAMPEKVRELAGSLDARLAAMVQWQDAGRDFPPDVDEKTKDRIRETGYW